MADAMAGDRLPPHAMLDVLSPTLHALSHSQGKLQQSRRDRNIVVQTDKHLTVKTQAGNVLGNTTWEWNPGYLSGRTGRCAREVVDLSADAFTCNRGITEALAVPG